VIKTNEKRHLVISAAYGLYQKWIQKLQGVKVKTTTFTSATE
jgi:hypothetical protein